MSITYNEGGIPASIPPHFHSGISLGPIAMRMNRVRTFLLLAALLPIFFSQHAAAYSLLTHEQIIDLTWQDSIVPLLLSHYPNLTPAELDRARAYAYGGCVIQDIGYYPFGDQFFSDLTHYVRTGDFVLALFRNAHNADELAFAIGALSHYVGDSYGHSEATNRAVAVQFPKLEKRYGPSVNYAEGKHQHVQVEFAFDIDQVAQHHLAPLGYLRHIGLRVPQRQVALAFYQTYGLAERGSRGRQFINMSTYNMATRKFIPRVAYALTLLHRKHEPPEPDTPDAAEIEKESAATAMVCKWDIYRKTASIETRLLAGLIVILPKFGALKLVAIKGPTPTAEADYMHSMVAATSNMRARLARFTPQKPQQRPAPAPAYPLAKLEALNAQHPLPNRDLDTGQVVKPGGYSLTDSTYAELLHRLAAEPARPIPPGIKADVEAYYADPNAPITTKKNRAKWEQVQADLKTLEGMPTNAAPEPYPTYGEVSPPSNPSKTAAPNP
jgi:Zinc dependent phospholipase C